MSQQTEDFAWKTVAGLLLFLQVITLAFCGYIVTAIDRQRADVNILAVRLAVVENIEHIKPILQ